MREDPRRTTASSTGRWPRRRMTWSTIRVTRTRSASLFLLFSALEQKIFFSVINDNILESWLENQSTERGRKLRGLCWRVCSSGHLPPGPIEHSQYNSVRSQSTTKVSGSIKVIQLELTNGTRSFCEIKYDYFLRS